MNAGDYGSRIVSRLPEREYTVEAGDWYDDGLGGDSRRSPDSQVTCRSGTGAQRADINRDAVAIESDAESVITVVPEKLARVPVKFGNINHSLTLIGTSPDFAALYDLQLGSGRNFGRSRTEANKRVVIVGAGIPDKFMIDANNLLDKQIHVGGIGFKVIGILNPRGSIGWQNVDEQIWGLRSGGLL